MQELLTMLESKYKRLEYIQSTGTQWIDTGISINNTYSYSLTAQLVLYTDSVNRDGAVWGARGSVGSSNESVLWIPQTNNSAKYRFSWASTGALDLSFNKTDFEWNPNGTFVNGMQTSSTICNNNRSSAILFGFKHAGSVEARKFYGKVYHYSVKDSNGVLLQELIPVLRKSDNEIGMLDLVEGKFYPNAGTGKFTANLDTMYAIIQGSPTVQDGRVSGFSSSNYLKTASIPSTATKIELNVTATVTDLTTWQSIVRLINNVNRCLELNGSNGLLRYLYENTEGISSIISLTTITQNMPFTFRLIAEGTNLTCKVIQNGIELASVTVADNKLSSMYYNLLLGYAGKDVFLGTIDLNRSYIKIDDTKYRLQAVVGYTKVGTPTITDNVASGFSSTNYLSIPYSPTDFYANSYEFHTKVKFTSEDISANEEKYPIRYNVQSAGRGVGLNRGKLTFDLSYATGQQGRVQSSFIATADIDYYLLAKYQNGIISFRYSLNGIDYILIGTLDLSSYNKNSYLSGFYIGASANSNYAVLKGSIDLNETYIKINNKLWFNGQPA